jgi:hypothetical protein
MITPFLALAIAGFVAFGAALFWVSIWSNLKPRARTARRGASERSDGSGLASA